MGRQEAIYNSTDWGNVSVLIVDNNNNPVAGCSGSLQVYIETFSQTYVEDTWYTDVNEEITTDQNGVHLNVAQLTYDINKTDILINDVNTPQFSIDTLASFDFYTSGSEPKILITIHLSDSYYSFKVNVIDKTTSTAITSLTKNNFSVSPSCDFSISNDGNGYYTVGGITLNTKVTVSLTGYESDYDTFKKYGDEGKIKLEQLPLSYTLTGTVKDENGLPVSNAGVNLKLNSNTISSATTWSTGQFSLSSPYAASDNNISNYNIQIRNIGFNQYNGYLNPTFDYNNIVTFFSNITDIDILVCDSSLNCLSGASVKCTYSTVTLYDGTTSPDELITISIPIVYLITGEVSVTVSMSGYVTETQTLSSSLAGADYNERTISIVLTQDTTFTVTISGNVTTDYPENSHDLSGTVMAVGNTNYVESFTNGHYSIQIPPSLKSQGLKFTATNYNDKIVTLSSSETDETQDVTLERINYGPVKVTVYDAYNNKVNDAEVTATPTNGGQQTLTSGTDGEYIFSNDSIIYSVSGTITFKEGSGYSNYNWENYPASRNITVLKNTGDNEINIKVIKNDTIVPARILIVDNNIILQDVETSSGYCTITGNDNESLFGKTIFVIVEDCNVVSQPIDSSKSYTIHVSEATKVTPNFTVTYGSDTNLSGIQVKINDLDTHDTGSDGKINTDKTYPQISFVYINDNNYKPFADIKDISKGNIVLNRVSSSLNLPNSEWHDTEYAIPWYLTQIHLKYSLKDISNSNSQEYISYFVKLPSTDMGVDLDYSEQTRYLPYGGGEVPVVNIPITFSTNIGNKQYTFSTRTLYKECWPSVFIEKRDNNQNELELHTYYPTSTFIRFRNGRDSNNSPNYLGQNGILNNMSIIDENKDKLYNNGTINAAAGEGQSIDNFYDIYLYSNLTGNGPVVYNNVLFAPTEYVDDNDKSEHVNKLSAQYNKVIVHSESCEITTPEIYTEFTYNKNYSEITFSTIEYMFTQDGNSETVSFSNLKDYMPKPIFEDVTLNNTTMTPSLNGNGVTLKSPDGSITFTDYNTNAEEQSKIHLKYKFDYDENNDSVTESTIEISYSVKSDPIVTVYGMTFIRQNITDDTYTLKFHVESIDDLKITESYFEDANPEESGFNEHTSLLLTYIISAKSFDNETSFDMKIYDYNKYFEDEVTGDYYIYNSYTLKRGWTDGELYYTYGNLPEERQEPQEGEEINYDIDAVFGDNYTKYENNIINNTISELNELQTLIGTYEISPPKQSDIAFTYVVKHVESDNIISYYENLDDYVYQLEEVENYYYVNLEPEEKHITDKWDSSVNITKELGDLIPIQLRIDTSSLINNIFGIIYNIKDDNSADNSLSTYVPSSFNVVNSKLSIYMPDYIEEIPEITGEDDDNDEDTTEDTQNNDEFNALFNKLTTYIKSKTSYNILCNAQYFNTVLKPMINPGQTTTYFIGGKFTSNEQIYFSSLTNNQIKNLAGEIIEIDILSVKSPEETDENLFNPDTDYENISFISLNDIVFYYLYEYENNHFDSPTNTLWVPIDSSNNFYTNYIKDYEKLNNKLNYNNPISDQSEINYKNKKYYIYDISWPGDTSVTNENVSEYASEGNQYNNFIEYLEKWTDDNSLIIFLKYLHAKYYELGYLYTLCTETFNMDGETTLVYGDDIEIYKLNIQFNNTIENNIMPYLFDSDGTLTKVDEDNFLFETGLLKNGTLYSDTNKDFLYYTAEEGEQLNYVYENYVKYNIQNKSANSFISFYRGKSDSYVDSIYNSFIDTFDFNGDIDDFVDIFSSRTFRFYKNDGSNEISKIKNILGKIDELNAKLNEDETGISVNLKTDNNIDNVKQFITKRISALNTIYDFTNNLDGISITSSDNVQGSDVIVQTISRDSVINDLRGSGEHTDYYTDNSCSNEKIVHLKSETIDGETQYTILDINNNEVTQNTFYFKTKITINSNSDFVTPYDLKTDWQKAVNFYEIIYNYNNNLSAETSSIKLSVENPVENKVASDIINLLSPTSTQTDGDITISFSQSAYKAYKTYIEEQDNPSFNSLISIPYFSASDYKNYRETLFKTDETPDPIFKEENRQNSLLNESIYNFVELIKPIISNITDFDNNVENAVGNLNNNINVIKRNLTMTFNDVISQNSQNVDTSDGMESLKCLIQQIESHNFHPTDDEDYNTIETNYEYMDNITSIYYIYELLKNFNLYGVKNQATKHIQRAVKYTTHIASTLNEFKNYINNKINDYTDDIAEEIKYIQEYIKNEILNFKNDSSIKLQLNNNIITYPEKFIMPDDNVVKLKSHSYNGYDVLWYDNVDGLNINHYVDEEQPGDNIEEPIEPSTNTNPIKEYNIRYVINSSSDTLNNSKDVYVLNPKIFKGTIYSTESENGYLHTLLYWNNVFVKEIGVKNNKVKSVNGTSNISSVDVNCTEDNVSIIFNIQSDIDSNISNPSDGSRIKILEIKYMSNDDSTYSEPYLQLIQNGVTSVTYNISLPELTHDMIYLVSYRIGWMSTRGDETIYSPATKLVCYVDKSELINVKYGYYEFRPSSEEGSTMTDIYNYIQSIQNEYKNDDEYLTVNSMTLYYKRYDYTNNGNYPMLFILSNSSKNSSYFTYVTTIIDNTINGDYGGQDISSTAHGIKPDITDNYRQTTVTIDDHNNIVSYIATFNVVTENNAED